MTATTVTVTGTDLVAEVKKVAEERPDFRYTAQPERKNRATTCSYVSAGCGITGGEGCIVGQALSRLGFNMHQVAVWEEETAESAVDSLLDEFGIDATAHQTSWLVTVQSQQDSGMTWAEAVDYANRPE